MNTYSVNEICKLCEVTRKQLRYYEERGILSEVPRDANNNYRYYTQDHICEIVAAKALKDVDMPLSTIKDVIHGKNIGSIQYLLQQQKRLAYEQLESSLSRYEQSTVTYTKLTEALSHLKLHSHQNGLYSECEVIDRDEQSIIAIPYSTTFEDETCLDIEYLPQIQKLAWQANAAPVNTLIYLTYDHFDSASCTFNGQIHNFRIATPVSEQKNAHLSYDKIEAFSGVSTVHIGDPKNKRLHNTYMRLLEWSKQQGFELENWSIEEWLISPLITDNKDLWVIRIMIPFKK